VGLFNPAYLFGAGDPARQLPPTGGLRPVTCETVFGLLAATGLRISEALALRRLDVDLERGLLTIRQSKFRNYAATLTMVNLDVTSRKYKGNERNLIGIV
jgi:integrase